jgi:hypothetical protein
VLGLGRFGSGDAAILSPVWKSDGDHEPHEFTEWIFSDLPSFSGLRRGEPEGCSSFLSARRPEDPLWDRALESVWQNHRRRVHLAAADRERIEGLRGQGGEGLLYVEVPELAADVHDLTALREILDRLGGPPPRVR